MTGDFYLIQIVAVYKYKLNYVLKIDRWLFHYRYGGSSGICTHAIEKRVTLKGKSTPKITFFQKKQKNQTVTNQQKNWAKSDN